MNPAFLPNVNLSDTPALQSCARTLRAILRIYKPDERILDHLQKAKKLVQNALRLSITNLQRARTLMLAAISEYAAIRRIKASRYHPERRL